MDLNLIFIILGLILFLILGYLLGRKLEEQSWYVHKLEPIIKERLKTSRAVLGGQFSEQLAPYLPNFPYNPSEVRFIGKPIDFLVFSGMDNKEIKEVVFVEVKSGKSAINKHERILRDVIKQGKVRWEEYKVPEEVTK